MQSKFLHLPDIIIITWHLAGSRSDIVGLNGCCIRADAEFRWSRVISLAGCLVFTDFPFILLLYRNKDAPIITQFLHFHWFKKVGRSLNWMQHLRRQIAFKTTCLLRPLQNKTQSVYQNSKYSAIRYLIIRTSRRRITVSRTSPRRRTPQWRCSARCWAPPWTRWSFSTWARLSLATVPPGHGILRYRLQWLVLVVTKSVCFTYMDNYL